MLEKFVILNKFLSYNYINIVLYYYIRELSFFS